MIPESPSFSYGEYVKIQCYVGEKAKTILQEQMLKHQNISLTALIERLILNSNPRSYRTPPKPIRTYFESIFKIIELNQHLYVQMNANASNLNQMMHHANIATKKNTPLEPPFWNQAFILIEKIDENIWHLRKLLLELLCQIYTDIEEREKASALKRALRGYQTKHSCSLTTNKKPS
ncbi:hypothetical protein [Helicobacter suis]|uniref:Uncharacterized protein n=1 Tax=Helicobacter suis TaxID=104628 RepID=A0A6J4CX46_9HELI|nr:hypothetical protein [Helicobacter suis]BCD69654.1 hypothetical protein SNTW_02990 [Helicobacter suis]